MRTAMSWNSAKQALAVDLTATTSLDAALALIRKYAAANPRARWIVGRGWNQERWGLGRFPTAAELDVADGGAPGVAGAR